MSSSGARKPQHLSIPSRASAALHTGARSPPRSESPDVPDAAISICDALCAAVLRRGQVADQHLLDRLFQRARLRLCSLCFLSLRRHGAGYLLPHHPAVNAVLLCKAFDRFSEGIRLNDVSACQAAWCSPIERRYPPELVCRSGGFGSRVQTDTMLWLSSGFLHECHISRN